LNEYYKLAEKIRNNTEVMRQKVNEIREFYE